MVNQQGQALHPVVQLPRCLREVGGSVQFPPGRKRLRSEACRPRQGRLALPGSATVDIHVHLQGGREPLLVYAASVGCVCRQKRPVEGLLGHGYGVPTQDGACSECAW